MNFVSKYGYVLLGLVATLFWSGCTTPGEGETAPVPTRMWKPTEHDDSLKLPPYGLLEFLETEPEVSANNGYSTVVAGPLQQLTPMQAVDLALANSPETRVSWEIAKARSADLGLSRVEYFPKLDFSFGLDREETEGGEFSEVSSGYGPSLELSWLLYDFGNREDAVEAAKQALIAANYDFNQRFQDVIRDVLVSYYNLNAAKARLEASKVALENAEATQAAAQTRLDSGLGTGPDALRAKADTLSAQAQIEADFGMIEQARADFAAALGIRVSQQLDVAPLPEISQLNTAGQSIDQLVESALRDRPALMAEYARIRESELLLKQTENTMAPSIVFNSSGRWRELTEGLFAPEQTLTVGLALEWTLFEGFRGRYRVVKARSEAERARQQAASLELDIVSEVWTAYFQQRSAMRRTESTRALVNAREETYEAIKTGYESGINNLLDLLTAQQDLNSARQENVQSEADFAIALARLAHAVGRLPAGVSNY